MSGKGPFRPPGDHDTAIKPKTRLEEREGGHNNGAIGSIQTDRGEGNREECVNKARQSKRRHLLHFQNPMPPPPPPPPPPPRISFHSQLPLVGNLSLPSGAIDGYIFSIVLLPRSFGFINPRLSLLYSAMLAPLFCPCLFLFPPPRLIPPNPPLLPTYVRS